MNSYIKDIKNSIYDLTGLSEFLYRNYQWIFVHIGKTGGTSLRMALNKNNINYYHVHFKKPPVCSCCKYITVVRNPIDRFISAFKFSSYTKRESFERALYREYSLNKALEIYIQDKHYLRNIHIRKDSRYYLNNIVGKINNENIFVIDNKNMSKIIYNKFNIKVSKKYKKTDDILASNEIREGIRNLINYDIFEKLYDQKLIDSIVLDELMR